jgi:predicted hydrocarbon binding protein
MAEQTSPAVSQANDVEGVTDWPKFMLDIFGYNPSTAKFRNIFVFECASNVFKGILSEIGPANTLNAIKPFGNIYGQNIASMSQSSGIVKGNSVVDVAMPYYFGVYCTSDGEIKPMEIRDGKAVVELYACPTTLAGSPPEFCAMSHFNSEGVCQAVNPDYEYVFTHHLNNGDDCCRFIVKKKSEKLKSKGSEARALPFLSMFRRPIDIDTEQIGDLEKTIPLNIPGQYRELLCLSVAFNYFNLFTTASVKIIGSQRTIELGEQLSKETGIKLGTKWKEESGNLQDLDMVKEKLGYIHNILNQKGEPVTVTGSNIEREIVDCPFKGALPEQCKHLEGVFNGVCEAINPEYEFSYDRMMSKGDHSCHWVVRKKAMEVADQQEPTQDDALGY